MQRTTVMLPADLRSRLARLAADLGISQGEILRRSLRAFLDAHPARDLLLEDSAVFDGESPPDLAAEHDRHLYGRRP